MPRRHGLASRQARSALVDQDHLLTVYEAKIPIFKQKQNQGWDHEQTAASLSPGPVG